MASIGVVPVAFCLSTALLYWISIRLPQIGETATVNSTSLKFPSTIEELTSLADLLAYYKENHPLYVFILYATAYLWKQTFAIPGSIFMNLLGGALYGSWYGFPLTCFLSAAGATNCYVLSRFCGKEYIIKYFPDKIKPLQQKVEENRNSLFFFLLFLRLFPMSPNWFMNMVAPILNVPMHLFFLSVFVGLMPYNFICVQTGGFLSQINSIDDILSFWTCLKLIAVANAALVPGLLVKRYHENKQKATGNKTE